MAQRGMTKGGIPILAAASAAILLCGCATPMPHPRATDAWRVGPVVERQRVGDEAGLLALRPIYSHETVSDKLGDFRSVTDVLWPLGTVSRRDERYYWRFLLFYGTGGAKSRKEDAEDAWRFRLFPFIFAGRTIDDEPYAALFPIGGTIRHFLVFDRISFALFPLCAWGETNDTKMRTVLWPLYLERHGPHIDQTSIWPLYGERTRRGARQTDESRFILWPFWSERSTKGDNVNGGGFILFPIFGHSRYERAHRGTEESWSVVPPLFTYGRGDDGYRRLNAPWPFIRQLDIDDVRERHVWPIYGCATNKVSRDEYALWPLFRRTETRAGLGRSTYIHAPIPFYFHREFVPATTNAAPRSYTRVWPLYSHRETPSGTQTRIPELSLWSMSEPIERNWAPLWSLYSHRERADGAYCTDILWGLLSWGRNASERRFVRVLWLFGSRSFNDPKP